MDLHAISSSLVLASDTVWLLYKVLHIDKAQLTTQVDEQAQQRLQGLTELYNVADDAKTQHMLLCQAIAYATKANLANLLGPVIKVPYCNC